MAQRQSALGSGTKTFFGLALLAAGFLATLATILGFLGGVFWPFDVLADYRMQYAIVLLVTAALYGMAFGRASSLIFVVMAAVNIFALMPLFLDSPRDPAGEARLAVVSYNSNGGAANEIQFASWLGDREADLVFVSDVPEEWLLQVEDRSDYVVQNSLPIDRRFSVAVLAKENVTVELLRIGTTREPVVRVETTLDTQPVVVYALQPRFPGSDDGSKLNREVMEAIRDRVTAESAAVVVVGDLSLTPWSSTYRSFLGDTGLVSSANGFGYQATWPADALPGLAIPVDHAFHSATLTTTDRDTGPGFGSSHRPLFVELAMATG